VEGDVEHKNQLVRYFTEREYSTTAVNNEENGILLLNYETFDVAIVEFCQNGKNAHEICRLLRAQADKTALIIMCSRQSPQVERQARQYAPAFYFVKPLNIEDLYAVVLRVYEIKWRKQQQATNVESKYCSTAMAPFAKQEIIDLPDARVTKGPQDEAKDGNQS
jgi:DNA-binding response OmpR family regulator